MSHDTTSISVDDKKQPVTTLAPQQTGETRSFVLYTVIAFAVAVLVRILVAAPYLVSGPSMDNTFHNADYLIVQKYSACVPLTSSCVTWGAPQRGDIIVFRLPQNQSQTLIKRVIGIPGDTITINGINVRIKNQVHPEGITLSEPYITPEDAGGPTGETITLNADQYFAMGDNRHVSFDSRSWGPLPTEDIIGRVVLRLYPFTQIGLTPGEARYQ